VTVRLEDGEPYAIEGDGDHPVSMGHICPKARALPEMFRTPDRLRHPLRRTGSGTWEKISWDEAFAVLSEELDGIRRKYGPEALAVHVGHAGVGKEFLPYAERFCALYGTPNFSTCGSHCYESKSMANMVTFGKMPIGDYARSRCIVLWGKNPGSSAPSLVNEIAEARRRGCALIVIDPRRTPLAQKADFHLQLRPGTDGALALGLLHVIIGEQLYDKAFVERWTIGFDALRQAAGKYSPEKVEKITWIPAGQVQEAARAYARAPAACISLGVAVELSTNGFQAARGVAALQAITGNLDIAGGAVFLDEAELSDLQLMPREETKRAIGADEYPLFHKVSRNAQANLYARAILEETPYPLKGLVVAGSNPVLTWPNARRVREALSRLEFLAVIDPVMTATAREAHLVLPCASFLGGHELWDSSHLSLEPRIGLAPRVCDDGELPTHWEIWREIAVRMGHSDSFPWKTEEEAITFRLQALKLTCDDLREMPEGYAYHRWTAKKYETEGFNTDSGKVEIHSGLLERHGYDPVPTYAEPAESPLSTPETASLFPLVLTTGARRLEYLHSRFRNVESLRARAPGPYVEIHPSTAHTSGVKDGDRVFVETLRGSIEVRAKCTPFILPGVISMSHGWDEANANLLTDDTSLDPVSGFPAGRCLLARIAGR
jgi:anaerobic selenocysteine-containing dehydrogenase